MGSGSTPANTVRTMTGNDLRFPELGFYTLAGQAASSRDLVDEVRAAEELVDQIA